MTKTKIVGQFWLVEEPGDGVKAYAVEGRKRRQVASLSPNEDLDSMAINPKGIVMVPDSSETGKIWFADLDRGGITAAINLTHYESQELEEIKEHFEVSNFLVLKQGPKKYDVFDPSKSGTLKPILTIEAESRPVVLGDMAFVPTKTGTQIILLPDGEIEEELDVEKMDRLAAKNNMVMLENDTSYFVVDDDGERVKELSKDEYELSFSDKALVAKNVNGEFYIWNKNGICVSSRIRYFPVGETLRVLVEKVNYENNKVVFDLASGTTLECSLAECQAIMQTLREEQTYRVGGNLITAEKPPFFDPAIKALVFNEKGASTAVWPDGSISSSENLLKKTQAKKSYTVTFTGWRTIG